MRHWMGYPGHEVLIHDIVHADNCYLYSTDGKRYIDLESGIWCTAIGHGHPRIQQVIVEQLAKIAHTGYCYSNGYILAQRPGLNVLRLDPSLTIEHGDIEGFLEVFEQVLSAA